ncbi:hypothetical protein JTE90_016489 [Oedothorax gibbosus]|uniref:NADH dehydrogenase [ubiquinone] 1 alpha subcomplex subunit 10, mitochondrial n=1 Tax=Oedothorax gibbosus TaxID=931172 RepID=A0AAV6U845_9ARAC|nr:hypothetical protein JTE90_016489 [Oedothorax gibbosus]
MLLISLPRLIRPEIAKKCAAILSGVTPKHSIIPSATIVSKENRDPDYKRPKPWPYETKPFKYWHAYFHSTLQYFDENTKIIVVDGQIGAGKSEFTKALAEAFDMKYIPEPTVDVFYTTENGYDLRKLDAIAPPSYKVCELKTFYQNPYHHNVAQFQYRMNFLRYMDYINACAHLLNTGQGVVMERSAFSDFVFFEAMFKAGYVNKRVKDLYYDIQANTLDELLRPHLVIYLDISPEVALERIKKRNDPIEVNSPVLTKDYLESIEYLYKQKYLKEAEKYSEILIYDWSNYGDVEVVVEDIERIDFDRFTKYDSKLKDWRKEDDWEWAYWRKHYTKEIDTLLGYSCIFRASVPEVLHPAEEVAEWREIIDKVPGEMYSYGFNPMAGDNVWFKRGYGGQPTVNRH